MKRAVLVHLLFLATLAGTAGAQGPPGDAFVEPAEADSVLGEWAVLANATEGSMRLAAGRGIDEVTGSVLGNPLNGLYLADTRALAFARVIDGRVNQAYRAILSPNGLALSGDFLVWTPSRSHRPRVVYPFTAVRVGVQGLYRITGVSLGETVPLRVTPHDTATVVARVPAHGVNLEATGEAVIVPADESMPTATTWAEVVRNGETGWIRTEFLGEQKNEGDEAVAGVALEVLRALRDGDYEALARVAHPEKGVWFARGRWDRRYGTIYAPAEIRAFAAAPVMQVNEGEMVEPYAFERYRELWLYGHDFVNARALWFGEQVRTGPFDVRDPEPGTEFVEYWLRETPRFSPRRHYTSIVRVMRLVFERHEGEIYLVAQGVAGGVLDPSR